VNSDWCLEKKSIHYPPVTNNRLLSLLNNVNAIFSLIQYNICDKLLKISKNN